MRCRVRGELSGLPTRTAATPASAIAAVAASNPATRLAASAAMIAAHRDLPGMSATAGDPAFRCLGRTASI